jgi:glycosyltransferase involved in cell wall biosynthesis
VPRKILAFVHAYVGHGREAGAETTLHDMLKALVQAGWQADVLISKRDPSITASYTVDGVRVIPFGHKRDLNNIIGNYDVAITHLECSVRTALVARSAGVPVVQLIHNSMWQTEGYLAKGCDLAIYNTEWIKEHHESKKNTPSTMTAEPGELGGTVLTFSKRQCYTWDHIVVHPLVNPDEYRTETTREYVTLVNLFENKGPNVLYYLAEQNPTQKFLAVKGGYGEQVIKSGYPNITFIDNTRDITSEVYAKSKVILMPSKYESYGRIAVEALASGIPTLASPTPGLKEALDYGGNYAPLDSLFKWHEALRKLLGNSDYYEDACFAAKTRSEELWRRSQYELKAYVAKMEALADRK